MNKKSSTLSKTAATELLDILKNRFEKNSQRHPDLAWETVADRLQAHPEKLWSLNEMEMTGGEPDAIDWNAKTGVVTFADCVAESPKGRRSICYDPEALASRKEHKPANSAIGMAADMGVEIMTEEQYRALQQLGKFDLKTSSWIQTPEAIRNLGGALFCDRRYNTVFVYHNGAESYYGSRGFRGVLYV